MSETDNEYSLDDWLQAIRTPSDGDTIVDCTFPNQALRDEYLRTVGDRTPKEVQWLISRLLPPPTAIGFDKLRLDILLQSHDERGNLNRRMVRYTFRQFLAWASSQGKREVRDSIYWVLDLLEDAAEEAIQAISAYTMVYGETPPDQRLYGLYDCMDIIRARYLTVSVPDSFFDAISHRDFEHLVERLYLAMGYDTLLTQATRDGGKDVIATSNASGCQERVLIDSKRWRDTVGVDVVTRILGVVTDDGAATKGVIVTTSTFSPEAVEFANRNNLELIDRARFIRLMNQHWGMNWPNHVDSLITQSKLAHSGTKARRSQLDDNPKAR